MGDMAEYYADGDYGFYEYWENSIDEDYQPNFKVWNGRPLTEMTSVHLVNTKNFLERKDNYYKDGYIKEIDKELRRRAKLTERNDKRMDNKIKNVKLKVVGVTFSNEDGTSRQDIIENMATNSPIILKREPHNTYDTNAIMVSTMDGQVGYIGKDYASIIAPMMDQGKVFEASVAEVAFYKGTHYLHIMLNER